MANYQENDIDSTTNNFQNLPYDKPTESSNNDQTVSSLVNAGITPSKSNQQQAENIIVKTKKVVQKQWEQTRQSFGQVQKKFKEMTPKQCKNLIYWQNPIQSGIAFGLSLSFIITFMCISSLAAIAFWLLAFLVTVGLYKLFNYVMFTFIGRPQDDIFESMFPPGMSISDRQAQELANYIRVYGSNLLKHARKIFLWENLTNSTLFGFILFTFFHIGLSMNALTFTFIAVIFIFTVPKIYQVYQVPIDRAAKQALDQINQLAAKITSKLSNKTKKS